MRKESSRRRVVAAAALATAIVAVLVPAAATTATPELTINEVRVKLAEAIADEKRAVELLKKKPPRRGTADIALERSIERLEEIKSSPGLPDGASLRIDSAIGRDRQALSSDDESLKIYFILDALDYYKAVAMAQLKQPASAQGLQCADKKDNDGDGTVDARHDSGCTSAKDGTERSALTCSLGYTSGTPVSVVQGTCSGPFAKLELTPPVGVAFDPASMPVVQYAQACRYASERRLECVMSDGVANPRHVVRASFRYRRGSPPGALRALLRSFEGRPLARTVAPAQAAGATPYLRFKLSYTHVGLSHVCASVEATSGALLKLSLTGPNGQAAEGTLQLKKKTTKTATGGFSFRILQFGSYRVTVIAIVGGKSVSKTQTISVTDAPGDSRCSATGAPPP